MHTYETGSDSKPASAWWRGGVIYQIYPRSFADSNGDGIGDLPGITAKLDYVAGLGVDAIWLSPFFKSPMKDFGYDISDYRSVDPIFGNNEDFDRLIARAHALGLKVMIDQVLSHTSDQHAWFQESRASRDNPKADWYVWADAKADGNPPNNWLSLFGGSAWQWDTGRRQYYLHNFLTSQPDLNFNQPAVQQQLLDEVEFWLEKGVDGMRLDVVNFYFHDAQLRDNPPADRNTPRADGIPPENPYGYQCHVYDKTRPENIGFLQRLRALLDRYPDTTTVGEIGADDPFGVMAEYTAGDDKLHMAYTFHLLTDEFSTRHIRSTVEALEARIGDGWPCWSVGNHDVARVVTRWGGSDSSPKLPKIVMALLLSLRGSVCLYQGEELALDEADIPFEQLQDPYGIAFWPAFKGRDGCRTPMPWSSEEAHCGFSSASPWLPLSDGHRAMAVDVQERATDSTLHAYRRFLQWRRDYPALVRGSIRFLDAPDDTLLFVRTEGQQDILVALNFSAQPVRIALPAEWEVAPLSGHGFHGSLHQGSIELTEYEAFFGSINRLIT